ncbi:MAG: penicillin-binding protein 2 [Pseudomonadota bacterium]
MRQSDEDDRRVRFGRRALVLGGLQAGVAGALGYRLYQLQVLEAEQHQMLAEENRINVHSVAPPRGQILDRLGRPLAVNRHNYRLLLVRERMDSVEATIAQLRELIDIPENELEKAFRKLKRTRGFVPVQLVENMDWEAFARVNANAPALPGVVPEIGWTRDYPDDRAYDFAHVVGYVAAVNEDDLARDRSNDPILRLPDARIGKNGVEKAAEPLLRGRAGKRSIEVNAAGRELRELERDPGVAGDDLTLTIDLELQRYAMKRLQGESAAAVVMDIHNGDILALASAPAYDPNKFVFGIGHADWNALREDEYDPLRNKAVAGAYPPGSTYKMLTSLAAVEYGVMAPRERIQCNGKMHFGRRDFHCWKRQGHGSMNMKDAIKHSCDIYFYEAARRIGIDNLAELSNRFGIGEKFNIEIPNLSDGLMPTKDWKYAALGENWHQGETLIAGIGQGYVLASPLQLAVMTARIANGEKRVMPRLIRAKGGVPAALPEFESLNIAPENMKFVQDGMNAVSNEPGGTAYRSQIYDPANLIAGKTGTAQVRNISRAEREAGVKKNEELPWRLRDHALFVAYAPYDKPRYAIAVVVEHGGSGSRAGAPVARDIMMRALYRGVPPLEAYPPWIRPEIEKQRQEEAEGAVQEDASLDIRGGEGTRIWGLDDPAKPLPPIRRG